MVASETGRRRVVVRCRTSVLMPRYCWPGSMMSGLMPCNRRLRGMTSRLSMLGYGWLGGLASGCCWLGGLASGSCWPGCGWLAGLAGGSSSPGGSWLGCLSRCLGRSCLLSSLRRAGVAAVATVVATLGRGERRCAECRAGESDECEFHEVVVHSAPSLSVFDLFQASPSRPYTRQGNQHGSF